MFGPAMNRHDLLTAEQERDLALDYRRTGDPVHLRRLGAANVRLVLKIVNSYLRYARDSQTLADLVQEGCIGLMEAAGRFDPARGTRFSTYASWWIRAYVLTALRQTGHVVRPADTRRARGRNGDWKPRDLSLDTPVADESGDGTTHLELLPAPTSESPERVLADKELSNRVAREAQAFADTLDARERAVFVLRWMGDVQPSLRETGEQHGLTGERIRQIEHDLLARLRHRLGEKQLRAA